MPTSVFSKEFLISAAFIFGGIIIISAGLYFLSNDIVLQTSKIVADRALIASRSQIIDALADLKKNSAQAQLYNQAMGKILVSKDQLIEFPRWLDGLARIRQVALGFSFDGTETMAQADEPGSIGFNFDITGSSQNLTDFVKDVESNSPRFLVGISTFNITRSDSSYRVLSHGRVYFR